jgi:hypothetical protein
MMSRSFALGLSLIVVLVAIGFGVAIWNQGDGPEDGKADSGSSKAPSPLEDAASRTREPIEPVPFKDLTVIGPRAGFGRIVDQDSLPVSSAMVVAMRDGGGSLVPVEDGIRASTDSDGRFELMIPPKAIAFSIDAG